MSRLDKVRPSRCPRCNIAIFPESVRLGRNFECPNCATLVRVKPAYDWAVRVLSFIFGCTAAYGTGLRGIAVVFIGIPYGAFFLILFEMLVKRLFPPRLREGEKPVQTLGILGK